MLLAVVWVTPPLADAVCERRLRRLPIYRYQGVSFTSRWGRLSLWFRRQSYYKDFWRLRLLYFTVFYCTLAFGKCYSMHWSYACYKIYFFSVTRMLWCGDIEVTQYSVLSNLKVGAHLKRKVYILYIIYKPFLCPFLLRFDFTEYWVTSPSSWCL